MALLFHLQTIIGWGFCDIRNNQGRGKSYQPSRRPRPIILTETLSLQDITKTESNIVLSYIFLKKIRQTPSQGTWIDIVIGNHAFRAQPTDSSTTNNNNNNTLFHPMIYKKQKFITIVQTMIGALAARNNLRVKNARQPVKRKDV